MNRKEKRQQKFAHVNNRRDTARDLLIQEARETLKIIQDWSYTHPVDGSCVQLPPMPESETIPADFLLAFKPNDTPFETKIEVVTMDTLSALKGLDNPCALVFASAKKPGGGWLTGAKAQEEDISRCSALWESLKDSTMYRENKGCHSGIYSDTMVYCPEVPIFKNASGLLPRPEVASFLASAAINMGVARSFPLAAAPTLETRMQIRMNKILRAMHHYGHKNIVLGSYGCGVFKNDIHFVAKCFADLLQGPFKGAFERVRFACIDPEHARIFNDLLYDPYFKK